MYKLHFRKDGELRVANYSPKNSQIIWQDTNKSFFDLKEGVKFEEVFRVSKNNPASKDIKVKKLKIQLGFACNYSCSYCSQGGIRQREKNKLLKSEQDSLEEFYNKLLKNICIENSKDVQIEFWGGETLLYWEEVKFLTLKFRESFSDINLLLFTNGSLIKADMADFCLLNKLQFVFSHDGPGFKEFRGRDPLEDNQSLNEIKNFFNRMNPQNLISFNSAINPRNSSLLEIRKFISSRLDVAEEKVVVNYDLVIPYDDKTLSSLASSLDNSELINRLFKEYLALFPFNLKLGKMDKQLNEFYEAFINSRDLNSFYQKCGMDSPDSMAVNLKGEVLTCQNVTVDSGHKIGELDDLNKVSLNTSTHFTNRVECKQCPVVQICKGACMFLEGDLWKKACDQHFIWSIAFLKFALYIQSGYELIKIEGQNIRDRLIDEVLF